jgi:hypothetical protein
MASMFVLGLVFLGMAGIAGYGYVDTKGRIADVEATETVTTQSLTEGVVALRGTVTEATEPLRAPLSDDDAVLVEWEVEEETDEEGPDDTKSGLHAVDFYLEDDRGRIRVRPDDPEAVTLSGSKRTNVRQYADRAVGDDLLASLQRFDEDVREDPTFHHRSSEKMSFGAANPTRDRNYIQYVLRPGDEVYVLGTASRGEDGEWVLQRGEEGRFLISDMGADALADHYGGNQTLLLGVVVVLLGIAGWAFANGAGLL